MQTPGHAGETAPDQDVPPEPPLSLRERLLRTAACYKNTLVAILMLIIIFLEGLNLMERAGLSNPNATLNRWGDVIEKILKHPNLWTNQTLTTQ